MQLQVLNIKVG